MKIFHIVAAVFALAFLASCEDGKSYAELLNEQDRAVNNFLADQVVLLDIPEDTIFEVGEDAPYYRLDERRLAVYAGSECGYRGQRRC